MKRTKGFTLIELLVVISIIALLVSILMPSLGAAREQAKLVTCSSNLRQLGLAIFMYADEYNNKVPPVPHFWNGNPTVHTGRDGYMIYPDIQFYTLFSTGVLDHTRKTISLLYCNSIPKGLYRSSDYTDQWGRRNFDRIFLDDYGLAFVPVGIQLRNRIANGHSEYQNPANWCYDTIKHSKLSMLADPWQQYHNGKGNVWFLDGHGVSYSDPQLPSLENGMEDTFVGYYGHNFAWIDKTLGWKFDPSQ